MDLNGFDHLLFVLIGIILPVMSLISSRQENSEPMPLLPPKKHIYFTNGLVLWIGALIILTDWNLSGKSWTTLGLQWPEVNYIIWLLCGILVVLYMVDSIYNIWTGKYNQDDHKDEQGQLQQILPTTWKEYTFFTFLAISAGICEEFLFRGFLVNYFLELFKVSSLAPIIAIVVPGIIFSVSHLYQGWLNVVKIMSFALLFGAIFLLSQSLLLVVILHVFVDLFSGAMVVYLHKSDMSKINDK